MRINIHNERHNGAVEDLARRRLDLVIGRFADRISHVDVHVFDENAKQKGGSDKVCTIEVTLVPRGRLFVQAKSASAYAAVAKAAHRAEAVVTKTVDRECHGQEIRHQQAKLRTAIQDVQAPEPSDVGMLD